MGLQQITTTGSDLNRVVRAVVVIIIIIAVVARVGAVLIRSRSGIRFVLLAVLSIGVGRVGICLLAVVATPSVVVIVNTAPLLRSTLVVASLLSRHGVILAQLLSGSTGSGSRRIGPPPAAGRRDGYRPAARLGARVGHRSSGSAAQGRKRRCIGGEHQVRDAAASFVRVSGAACRRSEAAASVPSRIFTAAAGLARR